MKLTDAAIEKYALKHSAQESRLLKRLAAETRRKTDWPQMMVGPLEGGFLRFLVHSTGARRVLEIGTFTGYSALSMAGGLLPGGTIVTCDIDPQNTDIAKKFWKRSAFGKRITLKLGPALQTLKTLKGPFDFVFIDADKENYENYWNAVLPKLRHGGIIAADNVLWGGRVLKPKDKTDRAIARFNRYVKNDSRVDVLMLPIRDGITLAVKR